MRTLLTVFLVLGIGSAAAAAELAASPLSPALPPPASAVLWWTLVRIALLAAFLFATVTAFKIPGTGIPELAAIVLLAALLMPSILHGDAAWYELVLIAAGLVLVCVEIFVIPGFGATGVAGILLLAVGLLLAFLPAASPDHRVSLVDLRNALAILVGGGMLGIFSFAWMSHRFPNVTGSSRLVLRETNAAPMPAYLWPAVGDVGIAVTDLKPGGIVQLPDPAQTLRRIDVVSKRGFVRSGSRVVVTEVVGQVISVKESAEG